MREFLSEVVYVDHVSDLYRSMRSHSDRLRPLVECGLKRVIEYLEDDAGGHDHMARHAD